MREVKVEQQERAQSIAKIFTSIPTKIYHLEHPTTCLFLYLGLNLGTVEAILIVQI